MTTIQPCLIRCQSVVQFSARAGLLSLSLVKSQFLICCAVYLMLPPVVVSVVHCRRWESYSEFLPLSLCQSQPGTISGPLSCSDVSKVARFIRFSTQYHRAKVVVMLECHAFELVDPLPRDMNNLHHSITHIQSQNQYQATVNNQPSSL